MADDSTAWISLTDSVAERMGIPAVPLPVSADTAALLESGTVDLAAIALDVSTFVLADEDDDRRQVLNEIVPTFAFVAALEFMSADEPALAARMIEVALRHRAEDPRLLAYRGLNHWDSGRRYEGLQSLLEAVQAYGDREYMAPMLWLLTARALAEAGRTDEALALLGEVARTDPREPRFWDLIDHIEAQAAARAEIPVPVDDAPATTPAPATRPAPAAAAPPATEPPRRRRRTILVLLGLLILAGGAWVGFTVIGADDDTEATDAPTATAPATTAAVTTTEAPTTTTTTTTLPPTTTVALVGVPVVAGVAEADAIATLEGLGLVVTVQPVETYEAAPGTVTSTDPEPATELSRGDPVTVTVASRPTECNDRSADVAPAGFTDVADLSDEATSALDWAADVGLVSAGATFRPGDAMTRAGATTVLWRYMCEPSAAAPSPFGDVDPGAFFAPAVAWAFEAGVIGGTADATFSPDADTSRAVFVTIVWRALGEPTDETPLPFTDVDPDGFSATAIQWAFGTGLVNGTGADTFAPDAPLDRITTIILLDRLERIVDPLVAGP